MKYSSTEKLALVFILAGTMYLTGCSGISSVQANPAAPTNPGETTGSPATAVYTIGSMNTAIKTYSIETDSNASPTNTITYPQS
jgi:PBP1b-binding outer membrane lipoprotein LpoB